MPKILAAGIAVLDIINTVDAYPHEDTEVRAKSQIICRGGNATNSLVVLSQLGYDCCWAGVVAEDRDADIIRDELLHYDINLDHVVSIPGCRTPASYITLTKSGSRTIVHYRDLPELHVSDYPFDCVNQFDWLHFEGRNVSETLEVMATIKNRFPNIPISVEIEKPREGIESLQRFADTIFLSKSYMHASGFKDPGLFLQSRHEDFPDREFYCAYGDKGVYAIDSQGSLFLGRAKSGVNVIDTLGAGDTLNAGLIHAILKNMPMQKRLELACELAGRKCGQIGLGGIDISGL